ncbi:MAG: hypothetical protein C0594_17515 [Marinilabiliales bacterium]|nr:MAG: hypothetical protein C0594_17515 [Marinilabiliales bacterium]
MQKIYYLLFLFIFALGLQAQNVDQSVLAPGGDYFEGSQASISQTIGEVVTETFTGSSVINTQGFQQTSFTLVSVFSSEQESIILSVYPNPVVENLYVESNDVEKLQLFLYDMNGKEIFRTTTSGSKTIIPIQQYTGSQFLLHVRNSTGSILESYKLIKTQ